MPQLHKQQNLCVGNIKQIVTLFQLLTGRNHEC